jgi:hypothetical protein
MNSYWHGILQYVIHPCIRVPCQPSSSQAGVLLFCSSLQIVDGSVVLIIAAIIGHEYSFFSSSWFFRTCSGHFLLSLPVQQQFLLRSIVNV